MPRVTSSTTRKSRVHRTVSHLRFGPEPIHAPYLIQSANFIACHRSDLIEKVEVLATAEQGAIVLLNSPYAATRCGSICQPRFSNTILERDLRLYVIDASRVASDAGMGRRINTVMQACFFALSGVLPRDEAIAAIKQRSRRPTRPRAPHVVEKNFKAVDAALDHLHAVEIPDVVVESAPFQSRISGRCAASSCRK